MKTIYKYPFAIADTVVIGMPHDAVPVHFALQQGVPCCWAIVTPDEMVKDHRFQLRGTGHPLGEVGKHLGTFFDGPFVWHVFQEAQ